MAFVGSKVLFFNCLMAIVAVISFAGAATAAEAPAPSPTSGAAAAASSPVAAALVFSSVAILIGSFRH